ncbi:MAG TPA: hypothetical protein VIU86_19945 [Gaiellaceae bacterium]
MRDLSSEQRRTLTVVACLTVLHGRAPTLRQIAAVLGCSRPAAHYRLHYLEKKGLWHSRSWQMTEPGVLTTRSLVDRALAELHAPPASPVIEPALVSPGR